MCVAKLHLWDRVIFRAMILFCTFVACATQASARLVIEGQVMDSAKSTPVPQATIRVLGTGRSTLANDDGRFRLVLDNGTYIIKVTHVACYSDSIEVSGNDTTLQVAFQLRPSPVQLQGITVGLHQYDPAQEIIRAAIKRKKDILSRLHDYTCGAYTRVSIRDDTKKDSGLFLIAESQTTCFWQQPDRYKEIITARRQTANITAAENLIALGEVLNFNQNRLELGRYAVVSPVASDALDHYNYYLLDTIMIDNRRVFRLDIEPKNQITPLFVGQIQIADSSYDVVAVDVGFNAAVSFEFLKNPRYVQRLTSFGPDLWMPVEIRFTGDIKFDVPLPGVPKQMSFVMVASVSDYTFDKGIPKGTFDEYSVVVAPTADANDTARWQAAQVIPLTTDEQKAYHRIDSTEKAPKPILKRAALIIPAALFLTTFGAEDLFRFNRVEGAYVGIGVRPETDKLNTHLAGGYAFSSKRWEGEASASYRLSSSGFTVGGSVRDQIVRRPAMITGPEVNTTYFALWEQDDPLDYYRERGFALWSEIKPVNHTRLRIGMRDFKQTSESITTDFSILHRDKIPRENPAITDGTKRSAFSWFTFDSRKRIKTGRRDQIDFSFNYLRLSLQGEWSEPDFLNSDFQFARYSGELEWHFRGGVPGLTTFWMSAGTTTGKPPVQSWFLVDHGSGGLIGRQGFVTLNENNFVGTRAAAVTLEHDFGRRSLSLTHIAFLSKVPFSVSVRGGAFWSDFKWDESISASPIRVARKAYSEIGLGVGNLTPFLSPFNFQVWFDWQLSAYNTERFSIGVNLGM